MNLQEEKIKELIEEIRPFLIADGGNVEFIKYEDNVVFIYRNSTPLNSSHWIETRVEG